MRDGRLRSQAVVSPGECRVTSPFINIPCPYLHSSMREVGVGEGGLTPVHAGQRSLVKAPHKESQSTLPLNPATLNEVLPVAA